MTNYSSSKKISFEKMDIDEIIYSYQDSSVPPPYHRSYDITITKDSLHIIVDSYGDIISDTSFINTPEQFQSIIESLDNFDIKNCIETFDNGCTGGTGRRIKCLKKGEIIFSGYVYYCGGEQYGNMSGDVKSFGKSVTSLIPYFDKILDKQ